MVISSTIEIGIKEEENLRSKCGILVILDGRHTDIACEYDLPAYLSPDRVASVIAARYLFKDKGSIVFDFGTTLTIDVIESDGKYAGGNISPGFRTRFKSLSRYSRTLPLVDTPLSVRQTGDSLQSSIESGVVSGIMFEIKGYLSLFPKNGGFYGGRRFIFCKKNEKLHLCSLQSCIDGVGLNS